MRKAFYSLSNSLRQWYFRLIVHIILGSLTAVVMVSASQCNCHWRECWTQCDDGPQKCHEPRQDDGDEINKPIWQVKLGSIVAETHKHLCHEGPEVDRLIICDVVCLQQKLQVNTLSTV